MGLIGFIKIWFYLPKSFWFCKFLFCFAKGLILFAKCLFWFEKCSLWFSEVLFALQQFNVVWNKFNLVCKQFNLMSRILIFCSRGLIWFQMFDLVCKRFNLVLNPFNRDCLSQNWTYVFKHDRCPSKSTRPHYEYIKRSNKYYFRALNGKSRLFAASCWRFDCEPVTDHRLTQSARLYIFATPSGERLIGQGVVGAYVDSIVCMLLCTGKTQDQIRDTVQSVGRDINDERHLNVIESLSTPYVEWCNERERQICWSALCGHL